jgi:hypothetical protein
MVNSWIRISFTPLNQGKGVVMHRIPQLLNNPIPCFDHGLRCLSTAVEEKRIRKTISRLRR